MAKTFYYHFHKVLRYIIYEKRMWEGKNESCLHALLVDNLMPACGGRGGPSQRRRPQQQRVPLHRARLAAAAALSTLRRFYKRRRAACTTPPPARFTHSIRTKWKYKSKQLVTQQLDTTTYECNTDIFVYKIIGASWRLNIVVKLKYASETYCVVVFV